MEKKGNLKSCSAKKKLVATLKNSLTEKGSKFKSKSKVRAKSPLSPSREPVLTAKERTYIISKYNGDFNYYNEIKQRTIKTANENKIFMIYGSNCIIRDALNKRGWVEKLPMSYLKLPIIRNNTKSNDHTKKDIDNVLVTDFLNKYQPNLIWETKETTRRYGKELPLGSKVNILKMGTFWTSKEGLCNASKNLHWFQNEADINVPRTYKSLNEADIQDFIDDYKLTACTSLLNWFLEKNGDGSYDIISPDGRIPARTIVFAINRCKEFLQNKEHQFIDNHRVSISNSSWNLFLKYYYRLIAGMGKFEENLRTKLALYIAYAEVILDEMTPHRRQLECEGYRNVWIVKPAEASRGNGIRIAAKLGVLRKIFAESRLKYIAQKYIEDPLLIYDTKFDIRQYFLVTRTIPLTLWMYKDCYFKFSSQEYSLENYNESIHLTNNAVQRKYNNGERSPKLPAQNMWSLEEFKQYLRENNKLELWETRIYQGMKRSIIAIMLSSQELMLRCKDQFELFGCDFILDKKFNPWLIEINSFPDMKPTTNVTAKICPTVLEDVIKVVVDYAKDSTKPTGNFECIYNQPFTKPNYGNIVSNLAVVGTSVRVNLFDNGITAELKMTSGDVRAEGDITSMLNLRKLRFEQQQQSETMPSRLVQTGSSKIKIQN